MDLSLTNHSSSWKEDAFHIMLDCLDMAVIYLSTDGKVLAFSRGAENLLHWRENFVIGKDVIKLCHETANFLPFKNIDDIISRPYVGSVISEWFTQAQEKKIWLEWHISPIYRSGNVNGILMIGMNITKYKESEERAGKVTAYLNHIIAIDTRRSNL